jgi:hypothetical protein|tara:strand:+ start:910 stop:1350 length:441 start_codon:yes stop_codon:yes gene_type:complete
MKRINEYKKLFGVEDKIELKALKNSYRNLVKKWHPDKFQDGDQLKEEAELKSRKIIDGYHFLVSMAPETKALNLESYTDTITNSTIADYIHKGLLLEITYTDGSSYEYFGVTKQVYIKMNNSPKISRFAKRSIYTKFPYRMTKRKA